MESYFLRWIETGNLIDLVFWMAIIWGGGSVLIKASKYAISNINNGDFRSFKSDLRASFIWVDWLFIILFLATISSFLGGLIVRMLK